MGLLGSWLVSGLLISGLVIWLVNYFHYNTFSTVTMAIRCKLYV